MVPDFFNADAFNLVQMTQAIQTFPNMYGKCNIMNLFPALPVTLRTIAIESLDGVLNLLPTKPVGAPPSYGQQGKRKVRSFQIPHIPHNDMVKAEDVQGIRAFGTQNVAETVDGIYAQKLATMRRKHAITLEHMRMAALKGILIDADGTTLYNFFTEFGISQISQSYALTTSTTEVLNKVLDTKASIEDNLKGEVMDHIHAFCSPSFYRAFTTHATVKEAFKYFSQQQKLSGDYRSGFEYGGVIFEEYRGTVNDASGSAHLFVPTDEAIAFPVGTQEAFRTVFAPANFIETVNTLGQELYAKGVKDPADRWIEIFTESNPLPICTRPELLVRLTKT